MTYAKKVQVSGAVIGLTDDYELTQPLAHFLALNEPLIPTRLAYIEAVLHNYRHHFRKEARWKRETLSYRFLTMVYDQPRDPRGLSESAIEWEHDARVRKLMASNVNIFEITYDRLCAVGSSELATWWYIFWVSTHVVRCPVCRGRRANCGVGRPVAAQLGRYRRSGETRAGLQPLLPYFHRIYPAPARGAGELFDSAWSAAQEAEVR